MTKEEFKQGLRNLRDVIEEVSGKPLTEEMIEEMAEEVQRRKRGKNSRREIETEFNLQ